MWQTLKRGFIFVFTSGILAFQMPFLSIVQAQEWNPSFNPNFLLTDPQLLDFQTFTPDTLKRFLESRPGTLGSYRTTDLNGTQKSVTDILWRISQTYKINPRFLLVLLQKEQSLVDDPHPTQYQYDWATGYARCDACSVNDPQAQRFKGFAQQLESAAAQMRYFLDHPNESIVKKPGTSYPIDGLAVIPSTLATAALYTYTPHLNGNYNLWKIWHAWFLLPFPDGSLLSAKDSDDIWLIRDGERHLFATKLAFATRFDQSNVLFVDPQELSAYPVGTPIKHSNFSLLKNPAGEIYLIVNDEMRFVEPEAFRRIGFNPDEVMDATGTDLAFYRFGEPVVAGQAYPTGALLQDKKTGAVFYVLGGKKYGVIDKQLLTLNFKSMRIKKVAQKDLDKYPTEDFVKLKDGLLVKIPHDAAVYFISNGKRRPIADEKTFNALGWNTKNIITVSKKIAALHEIGEPISINPDLILLSSIN
ncbi:MAG: hypothetical protein UX10_C0013G0022 [Candidatus Magasanikbacteria bacterium GW2011_GWA2_45_39]|uniref:Curculin domain protein (Mannose-binding) lectin n=2 Tax=Candidatus Magasanikiibacteriota TaxID=1752731 RepID=A0A0G1N1C4_9BACT|nr:MAG: hypothetical protein UX10_C0013G0022 [Candidatus Magasanikbacteria bacterium GW2011_GWA2_45_39]KKU14122.1 MAG: hypothetical protein UX20_C0006G0024 [Candidatus Magasanikbacteria bacterium GW2011_GWC2_45_8]HBW73903.1 hypothetical protein [Candidatus Magasanikbacteria bacterium]